jgi:TonB family protein
MKIFPLSLLFVLAFSMTTYAQQPSTADDLPANFSGDDPAILLPQLLGLKKRLRKNEFEATAVYEARAIEEKKRPIIGNRTIADTFNLVAHTVKGEYDPGTQMMSFTLPVQTNYAAENSRTASLDMDTTTNLSRVALYQVSLGGDNDPHVFFDSAKGLSGSRYSQKFTATAKLDAENAERLKTGTKALLIVRFEKPYATQEYLTGIQFMTRLESVQFFDQQTGRVLATVPFVESAPQTTQDITPPTPEPDYSTYRRNPSFKPPVILAKPNPRYTEEARRNQVKGVVVLRILLAETGDITRISVVRGLPFGLTERAIASARQIRFEPAELDGKKVAYPVEVVYRFDVF